MCGQGKEKDFTLTPSASLRASADTLPSRERELATMKNDSAAMEPPQGELTRARRGLAAISPNIPGLVILVAFLDLFTQLPVIAPFARSLGAGEALVGLTVAAYSASNLLGNMVSGQMLDRMGRKPPLFLGLAGAGVSLLLYILAQSPGQLVLIRLVHGFAAGFITPAAFTIMSDLAPPQGRTRAMGMAGAFIGIAAIVGPALAGVLRSRMGFPAVFLTVAMIMFVALLVPALFLRGLAPAVRLRAGAAGRFPLKVLVAPCIGVFVLEITLGILTTYLPLYLETHGYGRAAPGMLLSAFSLAAVGVMVSPLMRLCEKWGTRRMLVIGLAGVGLSMFTLSLSLAAPVVVLGMVLFGISFGIIFPTASAAVANATGPERRGRAFAIFYSVFSLGVIAGASLCGVVAGIDPAGPLPYYAGVLVALLGAMALALRKTGSD